MNSIDILPDEILMLIFSYLVEWKHRRVCRRFYICDRNIEHERRKLMWFLYRGRAETSDDITHIKYIINDDKWKYITNEYFLQEKLRGIDIYNSLRNSILLENMNYINELKEKSIDELRDDYGIFITHFIKKVICSYIDLEDEYVTKLLSLYDFSYIFYITCKYKITDLLRKFILMKKINKSYIDELRNKDKMEDKEYYFCSDVILYEM